LNAVAGDLELLLLPILIVGPGALLSFGLSCPGLGWRSRLWLAVALSPIVVAVGLVSLEAAGVDFATGSRVLFAASCVGMLAIALRTARWPNRREVLSTVAIGSLLGAFALVLWASWRRWGMGHFFAFHSLFHTDLCYAVTRAGVFPESPLFAGYAARYPFLAHYYWAWLGWLTDTPPNVLYRYTNTAALFAVGFLCFELVRALGGRARFALLAVALLMCGNDLPALVLNAADPRSPWAEVVGDRWFNSFVQKFLSFNQMPIELALIAGTLVVTVRLLRAGEGSGRAHAALLFALLVGAGTIYPLPFPPLWLGIAIVLGGKAVAARRRPQAGAPRAALVAVALATLVVAGFVAAMTAGNETSGFVFNGQRSAAFAVRVLVAFGPLFLVAVPGFWRRNVLLDFPILLLLLTFLSALGFYIVPKFWGMVEYKAVFVANLTLVPLVAHSLDRRFRLSRAATAILILVLAGLGLALNAKLLTTMKGVHRFFMDPPVDIGAFQLTLRPGDLNAEWTTQVRERTPPDTVLVAPPSNLPLAIFAGRPEFVAADSAALGRWGYGHRARNAILRFHGVPAAAYEERMGAKRAVYAGDETRYPTVLATLQRLRRPVAIRFENAPDPFLLWLERRRVGRLLFSGERGAVWLIDADESVSR
jgi:hypothetical protein